MLAAALLFAAVRNDWVALPGFPHNPDFDRDGVISGAEAWREMQAIKPFRPGRWIVRAKGGAGMAADSGRQSYPDQNFNVVGGDYREALKQMFAPIFDVYAESPNWKPFMARKGCAVSTFNASGGKIELHAACNGGRSGMTGSGSYGPEAWQVRFDAEDLAGDDPMKKHDWIEARGERLAD